MWLPFVGRIPDRAPGQSHVAIARRPRVARARPIIAQLPACRKRIAGVGAPETGLMPAVALARRRGLRYTGPGASGNQWIRRPAQNSWRCPFGPYLLRAA